MNEYMIRFTDGTIKHIKADACKFASFPNDITSSKKPMAIFIKNGYMYYAITLDSISAIKFPEVKDDKDDSSRADSKV